MDEGCPRRRQRVRLRACVFVCVSVCVRVVSGPVLGLLLFEEHGGVMSRGSLAWCLSAETVLSLVQMPPQSLRVTSHLQSLPPQLLCPLVVALIYALHG
jgi:hypothetical protein